VGKSTLLNALSGFTRALVTPMAGTTRDVVEQQITLGDTTLLLADTAGIRVSGETIEQMGIEMTMQRIGQSNLCLCVFDDSRPLSEDDLQVIEAVRGLPALAVINKIDCPQQLDRVQIESLFEQTVCISARNQPPAETRRALDHAVARALQTERLSGDALLLTTERQRRLASEALSLIEQAELALQETTLDVVYALGAEVLDVLGEMTGDNTSERVLDEVFSRFCVGK